MDGKREINVPPPTVTYSPPNEPPPNVTAPQPITVVLPQSVGQQYRDNRKSLLFLIAQGQHEKKREYGLCGIITALACFPFGLICLFIDSRIKCSRCGELLPDSEHQMFTLR